MVSGYKAGVKTLADAALEAYDCASMHDRHLARGIGLLVAGLGPLAIAGLLVPVREEPLVVGLALVLMASAAAAAAVLAGFGTGSAAVVMGSLSFDFFFTRPYLELKSSKQDLWTILLLLSVTTGAAALAGTNRAAPASDERARRNSPNQSSHIERLVLLIAQGTDARDLVSAVQAELTVLLALRRCRFETAGTNDRLPRLERNATVSGRGPPGDREDLRLPAQGVELPVQVGNITVGVFVLDPTPGASVSLEHRIVALILTDHLGAAIGPQAVPRPRDRGARRDPTPGWARRPPDTPARSSHC